MKLSVLNLGDYVIERFGFVFQPGVAQIIELEGAVENQMLRVRRNLQITELESEGKVTEIIHNVVLDADVIIEDVKDAKPKRKSKVGE